LNDASTPFLTAPTKPIPVVLASFRTAFDARENMGETEEIRP